MRRLLSMLLFLALLIAPTGMLVSHAAMTAAPQGAAHAMHMTHDDGASALPEAPSHDGAMIDCAIACSAMPAAEPLVGFHLTAPNEAPVRGPNRFRSGTRPEAATPPPRLS